MPKISVLESSIFSTAEVARKAQISENEAREWASELGVSKCGPAFAWTQSDIDALLDGLDAEESESEDDDPDGEEPDEDDADEEDDEETDDEDDDEDAA
jgi:hypothetical protein